MYAIILCYTVFLKSGKLVTGNSKAWFGNSENIPIELANIDHTHNYAPSDLVTMSTTDITAGSAALATGKLYVVYE